MSRRSIHPFIDAVGLHLLRFVIMIVVLGLCPLVGITGWDAGLVANIALCAAAAVLITRRRLWSATGMLRRWRSWLAAAALIPFLFELLLWTVPYGVADRAPGFALWGVTLLLVGINEELFSRGLVLASLRRAYGPSASAALTGILFGLQHLSALALTSRDVLDVLGNVVLSGLFGFALAAYQLRFSWLWPLILIHAAADWVAILATRTLPDWLLILIHAGYLGYAIWLLRPDRRSHATSSAPQLPT